MDPAEVQLRRSVRQQIAGTIPAQHVDECLDLAFHAMNEAFAAMARIVIRGSNGPVVNCAIGIALSLVLAEAKAKLESMERDALAAGVRVVHTMVELEGAQS